MANSPADDGWTTEQWRQIPLDPQQFDLEDSGGGASQCDAARQGTCKEKLWQRDLQRRRSGRRRH